MSQFIDLLVFPAHLENEFSDEEKVGVSHAGQRRVLFLRIDENTKKLAADCWRRVRGERSSLLRAAVL